MAFASSSEKPFDRTRGGLATFRVTPLAGFSWSSPFETPQSKTTFKADRLLSLTVFTETIIPVLGEGVLSRWSLNPIAAGGGAGGAAAGGGGGRGGAGAGRERAY